MSASPGAKPRLGFLGVGWIGLHRLRAIVESGEAEVVAIADPDAALRVQASQLAPKAQLGASLEELLSTPLDGVAIATPSALHAEQTVAALECGCAVFCQKPLARSGRETRAVVAAARRANRRVDVDFCYRRTRALSAINDVLQTGELGPIYSARFVFHNAYGPDKPWYYDRALSGGGCVMDLGIHLVDAALWLLQRPAIVRVASALYAKGKRLAPDSQEVEARAGARERNDVVEARASVRKRNEVEDYALAQLETEHGGLIEIACSWNLPAGTDAVIAAELYGPHGGLVFRNVSGSFYDFAAERLRGSQRETLVTPPDAWGGRAIVAFAESLRRDVRHDEESARQLVEVADLLDRIYGRI